MEIGSVENHEDFYHVDREMIHVQDQRGVYVMYDIACRDLKNLNGVRNRSSSRSPSSNTKKCCYANQHVKLVVC